MEQCEHVNCVYVVRTSVISHLHLTLAATSGWVSFHESSLKVVTTTLSTDICMSGVLEREEEEEDAQEEEEEGESVQEELEYDHREAEAEEEEREIMENLMVSIDYCHGKLLRLLTYDQ